MQKYQLYLDGKWVDAAEGATYEMHNPANLSESIGVFARSGPEDVRLAIAAAQGASPAWASTPAPQRGAILKKAASILEIHRDATAANLVREEGKTLAEAKGEVQRAVDILTYFAGEGWRGGGQLYPPNTSNELLFSKREPLGVVVIITPWNFPIAIPAWKIAPALIYGNTVVFKPAEHGELSGLALVRALAEAGLPGGVLNCLTGPGAPISAELVGTAQINGVSFTGSYSVGKQIYNQAMPHLTRVQLEMGGKNPLVVLDDADLELAVSLAARSGFGLTGQACTAASRVIVQEGIADRFSQELTKTARSWIVGSGLDPDVQMGPAVSQQQLQRDLMYIEIGQKEGARLLFGGEPGNQAGHFIMPTILDGVQVEMRVAQEEIFGPVIGIIRVKDLEEAINKANAIGFGLVASIVTSNLHSAMTFANRVEAGVVKINQPTTGLALQAPFGGFKHSSANTFKEQGPAAIDFYTRQKTIYISY